MRVIAGKFRSRPLQSLRGMDIRPTSDRLRETLFDVLCAGNPLALEGTVWLDLFAGTGAVGIEALSRGAAQVTFVERSRKAVQVIERNIASLGIERGYCVLTREAVDAVQKVVKTPADFIFLDPPYRLEEAYERTLSALPHSAVVKPSTFVIAEHDRKFDPRDEFGSLARFRKLEQGDAALSFYRLKL